MLNVNFLKNVIFFFFRFNGDLLTIVHKRYVMITNIFAKIILQT